MSIHNLDPWEFQYVKDLKDHEALAWTDEDAYHRYLPYSWIYDKYLLALRTGVPTVDLQIESPTAYPVMVKPRINLEGMSKDAYVAQSIEDIGSRRGMIAQHFLTGDHLTTDFVIRDGQVIDSFTFLAHSENGSFFLFEAVDTQQPQVINFLNSLELRTGVVNVETIGGEILEIHLRPSVQFYDICGGLIERLPKLIKGGLWTSTTFEETYSLVYRTGEDKILTKVPIVLENPAIRSIQLTWKEGLPLSAVTQDTHSFRFMVINALKSLDTQ